MVISKIELGEMRIPLRTPFKTALRTVESVHDIIVRVTGDDGTCGYGEAPATAVITGDTLGSIRCAVEDFIAPAILGMDVEDLDGISRRIRQSMVKNTSAKAAVDIAVYDLYARSLDRPLYKLLGGNAARVETDLTISVNPVDEMVRDSLDAVRRGFRCLKIKVGKEGLKDVERIAAIRSAVGPDVALRVDANQGWSAKDAVRIIRALEDRALNIDLVEQPVNAHDFRGMQEVTNAVYTPILADESVFSVEDAIRILDARAADLINIKLMKTGGISEALKICAVAETFGAECMVGCMLESKISVSAAAHLAAAKGVITRADLDGPDLCLEDPYTGGPLYRDGVIEMQSAPGLGITGVPCFEA